MKKDELERAYPQPGEQIAVAGIGIFTLGLTFSMLRSAYKRDFTAATFKAVWLGNISRNFEADINRRLSRTSANPKVSNISDSIDMLERRIKERQAQRRGR